MTWSLLAGIAGLAVLDSFNPATLVAVALILLGSRRRPLAETLAFVAGAFSAVLGLGLVVYLGAEAAASAVEDGLTWLRRLAFGFAALVLLVSAVRSLRPRRRSDLTLPGWFNPATAVGLGVVMTAADLPNAFPYVIAIERLVSAQVPATTGILVLAGYALVYCVPCLVLLAAGLSHGDRVQRGLRRLHDRFGSGVEVPASRRRALLLLVAAIAVAAIAAAA